MEVLIIVLCPSSLAHWLVGFWSGDSQMFFFVFFLFLVFWSVFFCFFFVSGFLACFFFFFCFFFLFGDFQSLLASAGHKTSYVIGLDQHSATPKRYFLVPSIPIVALCNLHRDTARVYHIYVYIYLSIYCYICYMYGRRSSTSKNSSRIHRFHKGVVQ